MTRVLDIADPARGEEAGEFQGHLLGADVSVIIVDAPPGGGPRLHRHPYEEVFVVQEGSVTFTAGDDVIEATSGQVAGFEPVKTSPPMDVLWFKLPRKKEDPAGLVGRFGRGHIAVMLDREDYWQAGYVIPKGTYPELRREGIEALRAHDFL